VVVVEFSRFGIIVYTVSPFRLRQKIAHRLFHRTHSPVLHRIFRGRHDGLSRQTRKHTLAPVRRTQSTHEYGYGRTQTRRPLFAAGDGRAIPCRLLSQTGRTPQRPHRPTKNKSTPHNRRETPARIPRTHSGFPPQPIQGKYRNLNPHMSLCVKMNYCN
jgi:hypothetical protein